MLLTSLQKYPWLTMCYQILRKEKLTIEVEKTLLSSKNREQIPLPVTHSAYSNTLVSEVDSTDKKISVLPMWRFLCG